MHRKTHMGSFSLSPPPVHIQFRREAICSCCCHSDLCSSTSLRRRQYMITREKGKASLIWRRFMVLIRRIEYHTILWSAHGCIKIPDAPWNLTSGVTAKHILINIWFWGWSVWRSSIDVHLDLDWNFRTHHSADWARSMMKLDGTFSLEQNDTHFFLGCLENGNSGLETFPE